MKSLDLIVADLSVGGAVFRLEFPKHQPVFLGVDRAEMLRLIKEEKVTFFKGSVYSVKVYSKSVVIKLIKSVAGHNSAKFEKNEFLALLASA